MSELDSDSPKRWYSIQEAAQFLDVGEPTIYRWMRENKITYRKVGDSTRFWREDLEAVMQIFPSDRDLDKARERCPICGHPELVTGRVRTTGLNYFTPAATRFWTLKDSFVTTTARMCTRCGAIAWFGDTEKLAKLRKRSAEEKSADSGSSATKPVPRGAKPD
jgi:excisionase family DNA binding protein